MRCRDAGFSLLELTIAMTLTMAVTTTVVTIVQPARGTIAAQPELADIQQRLRVGVDTLTRDLMAAGAGSYVAGHSGPLSDFFPPVLPFRHGSVAADPPGTFRTDTITVIAVPPTTAQTMLRVALTPDSLTLHVAAAAGCPAGLNLCGFMPGMNALVFGDAGAFDLFSIAAVDDAASEITVAAWPAGSSSGYGAGAAVVQADVHTYYMKRDPVTNTCQLMHSNGSANADAPILDHVVGLAFEYFGDALTPLTAGDDLRRIRAIGVMLRVEAGLAALRGPAGALFSNGGTATSPHAWMPDQEIRFRVSPRNLSLNR
jgi:hypothetical protein